MGSPSGVWMRPHRYIRHLAGKQATMLNIFPAIHFAYGSGQRAGGEVKAYAMRRRASSSL